MSKYMIVNGQFHSEDELYHYGVKGMQWGVRRATKRLGRAKTTKQYNKAVDILNKHRAKATKEISKLSAKRPKLERAYTKALRKVDPKIAKLERKKYKLTRKAGGMFTSDKKAAKLLRKSAALDLKIEGLKTKSQSAKIAMAKNEHMTALYKQGVSNIDMALASTGKKYVQG